MGVQIRANNQNLLTPIYSLIMFQRLQAIKKLFPQFMNVSMGIKRNREDHHSISGINPVTEVEERGEIPFDTPAEGFPIPYIFKTYKGGFAVSEENVEDDQHSIIGRKMANTMGRSVNHVAELRSSNIFNTATTLNGPDGVPLLSRIHPNNKTGIVQANRPAQGADLSVQAIKDSIIRLTQAVDDTGLFIILSNWKLIVHTDNTFIAGEILKSLKDPDTANNRINLLASENITLVINPYLADAQSWFIQADEHMLNFLWRVLPGLTSDNEFNTGDLKFRVRCRFEVGYDTYMGIDGSPGE